MSKKPTAENINHTLKSYRIPILFMIYGTCLSRSLSTQTKNMI